MRRNRWMLLTSAGFLAAAICYFLMNPQMLRARLVEFSSFEKAGDRVYFDGSLPQAERTEIAGMVEAARSRVRDMLGSTAAAPVVIVPSNERYRDYGSSAGGTAVSYIGPLGTRIVIGPNGRNVDVMAHEMMHAELSARAGYVRRSWAIPTWFDEGLAMYVDHREPFSEAHYQEKTDKGRTAPALATIDTLQKFTTSGSVAYLTSKHEFAKWYEKAGREGLLG